MATHSNGISALQLQKQFGLGSYKTAWLLCAKLRRAMVALGRAPLAGLVEVDETAIPCRAQDDRPGGSGQGKPLIAGAAEVQDGRPGRIRLAALEDFSATACTPSSPPASPPAPPPRPTGGPAARARSASAMNRT